MKNALLNEVGYALLDALTVMLICSVFIAPLVLSHIQSGKLVLRKSQEHFVRQAQIGRKLQKLSTSPCAFIKPGLLECLIDDTEGSSISYLFMSTQHTP